MLGEVGTLVGTLFFLRGGGNETVGTPCSLQEGYWLGCVGPEGSVVACCRWLSLEVRNRLSNSRRACRFGDMTRLRAGGAGSSVSVMTFVPGSPQDGDGRVSSVRARATGISIDVLTNHGAS